MAITDNINKYAANLRISNENQIKSAAFDTARHECTSGFQRPWISMKCEVSIYGYSEFITLRVSLIRGNSAIVYKQICVEQRITNNITPMLVGLWTICICNSRDYVYRTWQCKYLVLKSIKCIACYIEVLFMYHVEMDISGFEVDVNQTILHVKHWFGWFHWTHAAYIGNIINEWVLFLYLSRTQHFSVHGLTLRIADWRGYHAYNVICH